MIETLSATTTELGRRSLARDALLALVLITGGALHAWAQCRGVDEIYRVYSSTATPALIKKRLGAQLDIARRHTNYDPAKLACVPMGPAGGTVTRADRASVFVPAGSLAQKTEVFIHRETPRTTDTAARMSARLQVRGLMAVSEGVVFGPEGTLFNGPVTLTLGYNRGALGAASEDALGIYLWDSHSSDWEALPSVVNKSSQTVSVATTHFSLYQILAPSTAPAAGGAMAGAAAFGLRATYAFPNPVRHRGSVTLRLQAGQADSVDVRVYDPLGKQTLGATLGAPALLDDGNGLGPQLTYDYVWTPMGGSGVYTYVFIARRAGQGDVAKSGRFAVIR